MNTCINKMLVNYMHPKNFIQICSLISKILMFHQLLSILGLANNTLLLEKYYNGSTFLLILLLSMIIATERLHMLFEAHIKAIQLCFNCKEES